MIILRQRKKAFTLVELLIVIAVLGFIIAIAFPTYSLVRENSQKTICINNLKQIQGAIERWALENGIPEGRQPDEEAVYNYIRGNAPRCPGGGEYIMEPIGSVPAVRCTMEDRGHRLD